jgi:hypothetical protein
MNSRRPHLASSGFSLPWRSRRDAQTHQAGPLSGLPAYGLDQEFNSLDARHEAAGAYVRSHPP